MGSDARGLTIKCNRGSKGGRPTTLEMALRNAVFEWLQTHGGEGLFSLSHKGAVELHNLAEGEVRCIAKTETELELMIAVGDEGHQAQLASRGGTCNLRSVPLQGAKPTAPAKPSAAKPQTPPPPSPPPAPQKPAVDKHDFVLERRRQGMRVESKLVDLRDGERRPTLIVRRDTATSDPAICVRLLPSGAELVERKPSAKQQICLVIDDWLQQAGQDGQFGVLLTLEESTKPPFDSQLRLEEAELPTSETSRRSRLLLGIQSKAKHYQHVYLECSTPERAKVVFDALRTLQPRRLPKPVDEPKVVAKVPPKPAPIAHDPPLTFVRHPEGTIKFLSADRVFQSPPKGDPMTPVVMDIAKQLEHFGAVGTFTLQDAGELDEPSATRTVALAGGIEIRIPLIIKRSDGALHRYWLTVNTFEQAAALARVLSVQQR